MSPQGLLPLAPAGKGVSHQGGEWVRVSLGELEGRVRLPVPVRLSLCEDTHGCPEKLAHELVSFLVTSFQSQGS